MGIGGYETVSLQIGDWLTTDGRNWVVTAYYKDATVFLQSLHEDGKMKTVRLYPQHHFQFQVQLYTPTAEELQWFMLLRMKS